MGLCQVRSRLVFVRRINIVDWCTCSFVVEIWPRGYLGWELGGLSIRRNLIHSIYLHGICGIMMK